MELSHDPSRPWIRLYPHQEDAASETFRHLADGKRSGLLVMATGTGKSICGGHIARKLVEMSDKPILWLAHRDQLIGQAQRELATVGLESAREQGNQFALAAPLMGAAPAVVATVQTLSRDRRLRQFPRDHFGAIFSDEAHHSIGGSYKKIYEYFDHQWHIGLTATPDRLDGGNILDEIFGEVFYSYECRDAIRDGALVRPIIRRVDCGVDLSELNTKGKSDFTDAELSRIMQPHVEDLANLTVQKIGDRPTFIFTPGVPSAQAFSSALRKLTGRDCARAIWGDMAQSDKDEIWRLFGAGEIQYVCNCQIATEGTDVPRASGVVLARPTKSRSLMCQMIGRCLRRYPGKTDALVLDFAYLTGQHTLATPLDILSTRTSDPAVYRAARLAVEGGDTEDLMDAWENAEVQIAEDREEARKRAEEERQKREDRDRAIEEAKLRKARHQIEVAARKKHVKHCEVEVDPFAGVAETLGIAPRFQGDGSKATPGQITLLNAKGIRADESWSFSQAVLILESIGRRARIGMASSGQIKALVRYARFHPEKARSMTFEGASYVLNKVFGRRKAKPKQGVPA